MVQLVTEGPEYDAAVAIWNGAVSNRPVVVAICTTTADVREAIAVARDRGLPLSVRGGGHDWAGRALRDGGLVIDLTRMRQVSIEDGVATVGGGATAEDVAAAADRLGLAVATGTVGTVGLLGLTLGGGYGPLSGRFGLAADNLLGAEVVLADGSAVQADGELLWALRGGGGNFGVVTSARIAVHPLAEVLVGSFAFPFEEAEQVFLRYGELLDCGPDELTSVIAIVADPEGNPLVSAAPTWSGDLAEGKDVLDGFTTLGTPLQAELTVKSPLAKLREFDGAFPDGVTYAIRTRNVAGFTPDVVTALLEAYAARTSPGTFINIHHFHGAASRMPIRKSAFGLRDDHFMLEFIEVGGDGKWARAASTLLAPYSLPGGYPNLLGPEDVQQTAAAYGPNANRLLRIKRRLDPRGVFTATALPAGVSGDQGADSEE
ncbi:FAD-dependent oxidoreductase [Kribbella albertanoniae]|uniref:FAD-binding oxidoreductase n=1 Tax=Kribbella albertanoniae TaxID=1266829 RepID=A0A4R4NXS2_9ACTN|nr:FAD-binding oxidoreductase [Kribbella albertanoniae]TDC14658.1 FAD-binding oxidoreductase [Kribbella albertanoniae]